MSSFVTNGYLP
ncbi:RNA polymerase subunit RPO18, partial [Monkeypox virus]